MFEPVTITRSTSAWPPGAGAAPGGGGGGAGFCANALDARIKVNPTLATRAMRTNPNLFSTFFIFIISFSIGLVRFSQNRVDHQITRRCEARVSLWQISGLGNKSGNFCKEFRGSFSS